MNTPSTIAAPMARSVAAPVASSLHATGAQDVLDSIDAIAFDGLARMFDRNTGMFVFRVRRIASGAVLQEGISARYTAISLIGLAHVAPEKAAAVLHGRSRQDGCSTLIDHVATSSNLGDVALSLLAAAMTGAPTAPLLDRLAALQPAERTYPTVELAWTLLALCAPACVDVMPLRHSVARRLMNSFGSSSKLFPHLVGAQPSARSHVCCFADLVYSIQALSAYAAVTRHDEPLDIAVECARHLCSLQGEDGQWWWHYDYRTGEVLERYPVYAIHQDAMGPMALFAVRDAGGPDFTAAVTRGLEWLGSAPELDGASLIDLDRRVVWRKVARREPRKVARYLQATLSRVRPSWRVPAIDLLFPPGAIDYEDRPYHLGWYLYAWAGREPWSMVKGRA